MKEIWVRATLFSLLGVITALLGFWLNDYLPESIVGKIGADAVDTILNILSSSMLAVTTFSLSTMVAAYSSASGGATPRATQLLIQDSTTQNVLSSFIGSFLFSVVGIIALNMGLYGERGKVLLFIATLAVLVFVIYNLLRWINHLTQFGRLGETTTRVERVTERALNDRAQSLTLGAAPLEDAPIIPENSTQILSSKSGYVQFIDLPLLGRLSEGAVRAIYCVEGAGSFIAIRTPIAYTVGLSAEENRKVEEAFAISTQRSFEQDPRFGFSVLSEVASRALSPAVNDPGTAIDVISRGTRLFTNFSEALKQNRSEIVWPHLYLSRLCIDDLFDDFFTPIARDGATLIEVMIALQKSLRHLKESDEALYRGSAEVMGRLALKRAKIALSLPEDYERLEHHFYALMGEKVVD